MLDIIRSGNKALEKPIEELVVIHTQNQPAYVEMALHVPIVKLVRLDKMKSFSLEDFSELVAADSPTRKTRTLGVIFDDVRRLG